MRIILIFLTISIPLKSLSQNNHKYSPAELIKFKEEIKVRTGINYSIEVLKVEYYDYDSGYLFVDHNQNSTYNNSFQVHFRPSSIYNSAYEHWVKKADIKRTQYDQLEDIKGDWIPVYRYKGNFVLYYSHCNHAFQGYSVTDSTVINYYMDGPGPDVIKEVSLKENSVMINTANGGDYEFKKSKSNNDVFLLIQNGRKRYLTAEANKNKFPVIVELCHELGVELIQFDPID